MRKLVIASVVVMGALGLVAVAVAGGKSESYAFKATLTRGAEVPKPNAPATASGTFTAKSVEAGSKITMKWTLKFHGLSGKGMAAHIHKGKNGVAGPVLVALCGPCKASQSGTVKITSAIENALEQGKTYVNVHTAKNPAGEIRGQVKLTAGK